MEITSEKIKTLPNVSTHQEELEKQMENLNQFHIHKKEILKIILFSLSFELIRAAFWAL